MANREYVPHSEYPWWVRLSLMGLPGRKSVYGFALLSLVSAVASVAIARDAVHITACVLFCFAALMYGLSVRWVDAHGSWDGE